MPELDQLADSLCRARRELAVALASGNQHAAATLRAVVRQIEMLIAAETGDGRDDGG